MFEVQSITNELLLAQPTPAVDQLSWFAVLTRPRFEKKVTAELQEKGIIAFLPLNSVLNRWSDRRRLVHLPLFPGYTFVRTSNSLEARVAVLRTSGVTGFAGVRGIGTPIPDQEIEAIQAVLERKIPFESYPYAKVGQQVRIRGGFLDGVIGTLAAVNGDQSLVVSVNLIQRSIAMRVSGFEIEEV
jgi:transcription antitermination factor NusG